MPNDEAGIAVDRSDVVHLRPRSRAGEGDPSAKLDVAREDANEIGVGDAQLRNQPVIAIILFAKRPGNIHVVAGEQAGYVDQQPAVGGLGGDVGHPYRRISEGPADALLLLNRRPAGAESRILDFGDELLPDATKDEQARTARQCAIEPQRGRSKPGLERGYVDEPADHSVGIGRRKRKDDPTAVAIDMDREESVLANRVLKHFLRRCQRQRGRRKQGGRDHHQDKGKAAIHRIVPQGVGD